MTEFDDLVAQFDEMLRRLLRERERADSHYSRLRPVLARLDEAGILHEATILGPVVVERDYAEAAGARDTHQVVQAALRLPGGVGWDSGRPEQFHEDANDGPLVNFVPFGECAPSIQALLLPCLEPLVREAIDRARKALMRPL